MAGISAETCKGRDFAGMPLSLGSGKDRSTQELATTGAVTTRDLKGQGAGFRAGDTGGTGVQKGTAQPSPGQDGGGQTGSLALSHSHRLVSCQVFPSSRLVVRVSSRCADTECLPGAQNRQEGQTRARGTHRLWIRVRERGPSSSSAANSPHGFSSCFAILCLSFLLWGMEKVGQVNDSQSLLHLLLVFLG